MKERPDLPDSNSPGSIEVIQLTTEPEVPASHIYMEAQIFTLDSKRLVVHRSAHAHGSDQHDPEHRYLLCDLEDDCSLSPLTHETGATGPSVSPDGKHLYYFVNETETNGGRLTLRRVTLDGLERETVFVVDSELPGTDFRPSRIYPLSTISSDGRRIAISGFLGDGTYEEGPYGLMVFDIEEASVELVLHGPTWCNMHPQYCRSTDEEAKRDILVQENHDNRAQADGTSIRLDGNSRALSTPGDDRGGHVSGLGADIHVIRDDGTDFRNMPWGRDGNEFCQGHQCWRGRMQWAITSTSTREPSEAQLIESTPAPHAGHVGINTPGGVRNDLSRDFPGPHFHHFGTDIEGRRIVSDQGMLGEDASIYLAELGAPGEEPLQNPRYLLTPCSSCDKFSHIHPFLSPDGTMAFFNSDESGLLQAYMIRGL